MKEREIIAAAEDEVEKQSSLAKVRFGGVAVRNGRCTVEPIR